jgi:hypothetical protein
MIDEEQLRSMTPQQRRDLLCTLAAMDPIGVMPSRGGDRRRAIALVVIVVCCVVLAINIGVLATTLPRYYRTGGWRGAWVGFDLALLGAFAATGWAFFQRRQLLIISLVVLATLLCCDAWFDVVLDARTAGFALSLLLALLVELPLAVVAIIGARRLLHITSEAMLRYRGYAGPRPRLRDMPLVGTSADRPLRDLLAASAADRAGPKP